MSNTAVGISNSNSGLGCTQPKTQTRADRSEFRLGDVLLETAISVTAVRVAHAHNEQEHEDAFAELQDRWSQRECWATAEAARAQLRVDIDNRIQDHLHQQMDAERESGGKTLDQFLAGQK
jgi:hypothetical protein